MVLRSVLSNKSFTPLHRIENSIIALTTKDMVNDKRKTGDAKIPNRSWATEKDKKEK
jgi:hypothetical protein